jgi:hypothetical protein
LVNPVGTPEKINLILGYCHIYNNATLFICIPTIKLKECSGLSKTMDVQQISCGTQPLSNTNSSRARSIDAAINDFIGNLFENSSYFFLNANLLSWKKSSLVMLCLAMNPLTSLFLVPAVCLDCTLIPIFLFAKALNIASQ